MLYRIALFAMTLSDRERSFQLPETSSGAAYRKVQHVSLTRLITTKARATTLIGAFEQSFAVTQVVNSQISGNISETLQYRAIVATID